MKHSRGHVDRTDSVRSSLLRLNMNQKLCVCVLLVDEAGKMVSEDGTEVTVEGAVEDQEVEKDEDGQEVIKVYIFKADSGEDDMGESQC